MNDDAKILSISDLSVDFRTPRGRLHALRQVNFSVPTGTTVGVVGESGCGKSTLINAIIGLLSGNAEVTSGRIVLEGDDLLGLSEARMRREIRGKRIAMIFQDPMTSLNPVLSIGRQMCDIQFRERYGRAEKRRRAAGMLERVGIPDAEKRLDQYPHQFSGGMRQRIAIAMAMLAKPDLLIADEPTTALDATLEVQIMNLLTELQQETGCAILFISHHLGVIAELCREMVVMYAGEVVEAGPVERVFTSPAHPYTEKLLECDPGRLREVTRNLPTVPGELPDLTRLPGGCIFTDRCPYAWERCRSETPGYHQLDEGQYAACHRLDVKERETAG
ncbi:ABC transporter ATP-binding protein [Fodinicurvata halophila]|uniref:ABC transporter ATP-binding protein n=1 Tax=Fodinicurvata halophila TaxID=1419723 RepID=A0ABV8UHE7_9PROT